MRHLQAIRSDPGYVDQVPRKLAYQAAHPDTEIIWCGPYWKAVIREGEGSSTEINRVTLEWLLDKLESLP